MRLPCDDWQRKDVVANAARQRDSRRDGITTFTHCAFLHIFGLDKVAGGA